jgi:putative DNA primase/helicase
VLGTPNYVVSYAGPTSQGKTTALRAAASCFGCPDERSPSAAIATWDSTRVWLERASAVQNDLPLIVDDTKRASRPADIAQLIYDVSSGRSRGRGSIEGMRGTDTFRTVMLASGEAPLTSFSQDGGTRARVLELWGSPFAGSNAELGRIVNGVNNGVLQNYGHAGPGFVRWLIDNRCGWPDLRIRFETWRQHYENRAGDNAVAGRMAPYFAMISFTTELAHGALQLPWDDHDVVDELWPQLTAETPEADRAAAALRHVLSWARGHRTEFYSKGNESIGLLSGGCAGRWDHSGPANPWKYIAFLPHKLDEVLESGGFDPEPIRRGWADRHWLQQTPGRSTYRTRIGSENTYVVAITREAVEAVEGPDSDTED